MESKLFPLAVDVQHLLQKDTEARIAFNKGCQARLDGQPLNRNPYFSDRVDFGENFVGWKRGWEHVDSEWGIDVTGGRQIRPLPLILDHEKCRRRRFFRKNRGTISNGAVR